MDRFHIVISNFNRIESFIRNFNRIINFDLEIDRIYVMDCSPEENWASQLEQCRELSQHGLKFEENLFFIRRRNWNMNHGAQLDYIKAVLEGEIEEPSYIAFVQEHYFDLDNFIKDDTLPENAEYDLNAIEAKFHENRKVGCAFFSRNGVRISMTNPLKSVENYFWGDEETIHDEGRNPEIQKPIAEGRYVKGSKPRCFFVDGGNFIIKPSYYTEWFKTRKDILVVGDGSYGFCHVWEIRLGYILYEQNIEWADMLNNLSFRTIGELAELEGKTYRKYSKPWYENRVWFYFYGRDMVRYLPFPWPLIQEYRLEYFQNKSLQNN